MACHWGGALVEDGTTACGNQRRVAEMNKQYMALVVMGVIASGCSSEFWRGGGAGAATGIVGTGAGYELRARQQMEQLEADHKAGRINEHDYAIRKDQIQKGSVFY